MKFVLVAASALFLLTNCGKSNPLFGTWGGFEPVKATGATLVTKIKIEESSLTSISQCDFSGTAVTSSVSAPAEITASTIKITEAKEHSEKSGQKTCKAQVSVGTLNYKVDGDKLVLSVGEDSVTLTRE